MTDLRKSLRLSGDGQRDALAVRAGKAWLGWSLTPVDDALILVADGRITACGKFAELRKEVRGEILDLRDRAVAPGLINAHTHLQLSHLKGKTVQGQGFAAWVASMMAQRGAALERADLDAELQGPRENGTAVMADIFNVPPGIVPEAMREAGIGWLGLAEVLGWPAEEWDGTDFRPWGGPADLTTGADLGQSLAQSLAGHALYSTAPRLLRAAKDWTAAKGRPYSLHLAEHEDEVEVLTKSQGRFADMLKVRLVPREHLWPGTRPVVAARDLGLLGPSTLAVHCVQLTDADIAILANSRTNVCLCPRSNAHIGVGRPRVAALLAAGINLCLGTDSLSSNADLDVWNEAATLRREYGVEDMVTLLRMATINAAKALGIADRFGSISPGKAAVFHLPEQP